MAQSFNIKQQQTSQNHQIEPSNYNTAISLIYSQTKIIIRSNSHLIILDCYKINRDIAETSEPCEQFRVEEQ